MAHVDLPLCNESLRLLDLVAGCGVTYIFAFGLLILDSLYTSAVRPFRAFDGRGPRTRPDRALNSAIEGQAPFLTNFVSDLEPSQVFPVTRRVL